MNKLLPSIITITLLTLTSSPVLATESTTPTPATTAREAFKENRDKIREDQKETHEAYQTKMLKAREAFKEKLKSIKDTRKQAVIERIGERLPEINTKRTDAMSQSLIRLSAILEREASKTATITPAPSFDTSLLATARVSIITAEQAIATQKAKEYVITLDTSAPLGQSVKTTINALQADLKSSNQTVIAARTAVIAALKAMTPTEPTTTQEGAAN